jgi:hypothetical protein
VTAVYYFLSTIKNPKIAKTRVLAASRAVSSKKGVKVAATEIRKVKYIKSLDQSISVSFLSLFWINTTINATGIASHPARYEYSFSQFTYTPTNDIRTIFEKIWIARKDSINIEFAGFS